MPPIPTSFPRAVIREPPGNPGIPQVPDEGCGRSWCWMSRSSSTSIRLSCPLLLPDEPLSAVDVGLAPNCAQLWALL